MTLLNLGLLNWCDVNSRTHKILQAELTQLIIVAFIYKIKILMYLIN